MSPKGELSIVKYRFMNLIALKMQEVSAVIRTLPGCSPPLNNGHASYTDIVNSFAFLDSKGTGHFAPTFVPHHIVKVSKAIISS
jgi:hypothetical protein